MTLYRIVDWDKHFENNRTREMSHMTWVPIPNRMDDDGYVELLDHKDGAAHLGAWLALVQIASRCGPRGTLLRGGSRPHNFASLSRVSRISEAVFRAAIPRLIEIGWLEAQTVANTGLIHPPQEGAEKPQEGAGFPQGTDEEGKEGKEGNGRKGMEGNTPFDEFWKLWPSHGRKAERKQCFDKWRKDGLDSMADRIMDSLRRWLDSEDWAEDGGKFIPAPLVWLNKARWEGTPKPKKRKMTAAEIAAECNAYAESIHK